MNVSITVNDSGGRSEQGTGDRQQAGKQLGRLIEARVLEVITDQKRPGGLLYA